MAKNRHAARQVRGDRVRYQIARTSGNRLRLSVFRSVSHIYAQIIDDVHGRTLVAASTLDAEIRSQVKSGGNKEAAVAVGRSIAERALKANIRQVVFDRGGCLFHGRVKALADSAREGGLEF
ncbi:MAG: 50S ribosomal protein L18 [Magnetococcus sp. YQC-3]|jgi:large subunit ribosomal protein L18